MPRIRTIKPEFWSDEKLGPLSPLERLTFLGLIGMADDMGRLLDNLKQIDAFIFPYTDDTARAALVRLEECGRIVRGETSQGQKIIQLVNWHHQKIEKPNIAGALPPLAGAEDETTAYRARKRVPQHLKDEVWLRDKSTCQDCGRTPLRRHKADRYDAGDDLGEVDHAVEAADGGMPTAENLRLLCLPCNRKKAGKARRERLADRSKEDKSRVSEESESNQRPVADTSPPLSTTVYQRPDTGDQRPAPLAAARALGELRTQLARTANDALDAAFGTADPRRRPLLPASAAAVLEVLDADAIPLEFACTAIRDAVPALKEPPRSLAYFAPIIRERWGHQNARGPTSVPSDSDAAIERLNAEREARRKRNLASGVTAHAS